MMKNNLTKLSLLLILNVSFIFSVYAEQNEEGERALKDQASELVKIRVKSQPMAEVLTRSITRINADVISLNHAQISAQAAGEVLEILAEVGDHIEKNTAMVVLDCQQSKLNQAAAKDGLNLARKEYKRAQSLQKTKTIAEQQFNQSRSALDQARIRNQQADIAVQHCVVKAPFSGVVTARQVQLGSVASPGAPMLMLLQSNQVEVSAQLESEALRNVREQAVVQFVVGDKTYPLIFRAALPMVDAISNKQNTRFRFTADQPYAGISGEIHWQTGQRVLPVDFIVQRAEQLGFFIVKSGVAQFNVLPNARLGHPASVPLNMADQHIITVGRHSLQDGDEITVLSPEAQ